MADPSPSQATTAARARAAPIRVLVVDDSAVIRGIITRVLTAEPDIVVAASAQNGRFAIDAARRQPFDVIVLDIEMPIMDGITALPHLLQAAPGAKVVMASTLTARNAAISLKALAAGASDYVPKPMATSEMGGAMEFSRELVAKVRALGQAARKRPSGVPAAAPAAPSPSTATRAPVSLLSPSRPLVLRKPGPIVPKVLAIGSSTGGPQALLKVLEGLRGDVETSVLITQHMPATFTRILAEHISNGTGTPCTEGQNGEILKPGHIYLAPGGYHMLVEKAEGAAAIKLTQDPPENFCRPAVDPMLRSIVGVYGGAVLVVILTGMGDDGKSGAEAVVHAGGTIMAQDEATSVVWGMPGAVATAGLCSVVAPLSDIASHVKRVMKGRPL